jgi:hypothetical protein
MQNPSTYPGQRNAGGQVITKKHDQIPKGLRKEKYDFLEANQPS